MVVFQGINFNKLLIVTNVSLPYLCTYINVKLMRQKIVKDTKMEEQIIAAAKRVFFTEGKLHATMQDIADEIGVTRPVVNYYFRTKDVLMEKFYKETIECLTVRLNFLLDTDSSFYNNISNFIEDSFNARNKYPYVDTFMVIEMNCRPLTSDLSEYKAEKFMKFLKIVQQEMDKNTLLKTDPLNFLFDLFSLITYPLVIGPLYKNILDVSDKRYKESMAERKEIILKRLFVK
jgi:TetR/AcrR family transcriptional regulator